MIYPLISVCIVTYNHQDYIEDCLLSVLAQKGDFKLQILIGDDASNDSTIEIVNKIISHNSVSVKVYSHKKNLGASQNYQFLIDKAQGDYIAHLDGDDYWLLGKLKAQLAFLGKHSSCIACYTNAMVVTNEKEPWGVFNYPQKELITLEELLIKGNFLNHSSLLYRNKGKQIILNFPEEFIDFRIHLSLALQDNLGYINKKLVTYRVNSHTSMLKHMPKKVVRLYYDALVSIKEHVPEVIFKTAINRYSGNLITDLLARRELFFLYEILYKIKKENSLSWGKILTITIFHSIPSELNYIFKKFLSKSDLKTLKRNSEK